MQLFLKIVSDVPTTKISAMPFLHDDCVLQEVHGLLHLDPRRRQEGERRETAPERTDKGGI